MSAAIPFRLRPLPVAFATDGVARWPGRAVADPVAEQLPALLASLSAASTAAATTEALLDLLVSPRR